MTFHQNNSYLQFSALIHLIFPLSVMCVLHSLLLHNEFAGAGVKTNVSL